MNEATRKMEIKLKMAHLLIRLSPVGVWSSCRKKLCRQEILTKLLVG
jgi:hypothetical protein